MMSEILCSLIFFAMKMEKPDSSRMKGDLSVWKRLYLVGSGEHLERALAKPRTGLRHIRWAILRRAGKSTSFQKTVDNMSAIALLVIPFTTQPMISFSLALKASCSEDSSSGSLTASLILLQIVSMSSLIEIVVS